MSTNELKRVWLVEEQSASGDSTIISVHTTEEGAMNRRWREKEGMSVDKPWVEDYYVYSMILFNKEEYREAFNQ